MSPLKEYIHLLKKFKRQLAVSIACQFATAVFTVVSIPMIIPFFQILFAREPTLTQGDPTSYFELVKQKIALIILENDQNIALLYICSLIALIFFLKNLFRYLASYFIVPVRNGIVYEIRQKLMSKYLKLPVSFFEKNRKGDLLARMSTDVQEVEWSIIQVIESLFKSPLIILGSIAIMIYISPRLSLFVIVLFAFTVLIIGGVSKSLKRKSMLAQNKFGSIVSFADEILGGMKTIHAFSKKIAFLGKFENLNKDYKKLSDRVLRKRDLSSPISEFLGILVVVILLWVGSNLVFSDNLAPEIFFAFVFAFYQVIEPSKSFATAYYNFQKGSASLNRIVQIFDEEEEVRSHPPLKFAKFEDNIQFHKINFRYPGEEKLVLFELNLKINKSEIIALIGGSGAGKSTIFDLLLRFYDDYSGNIELDGFDIRRFDKNSVRKLFSLVSQDPFLFHDSVVNNIVFGQTEPDMNKVVASAKKAYAHDFICRMGSGYQTSIGDRGVILSGGERQRIALARAFYKDSPILLLDEATSALDSESEMLVQRALKNELKGKTAIIIAHRMSTIQIADRVLFLKDGRIVEDGKHEQLLELSGQYRNFVHLQSI